MLAFDRVGSGPPLLLIHGLGSRREIWEPLLERLARAREVTTVDLPGFGDSPPLPAGTTPTPAALTDAVEELVGELGRAEVAGNSLGGWIALELARRGRASSVTAFSPAGFWNKREARFASVSMAVAQSNLRALRPALPAIVESPLSRPPFLQYFARPWRVPSRSLLANVRGYADAPGFDVTRRALFAERFPPQGQPDVPVTIAWGTRDLLLIPRQARRAARRFPNAQLVRLRGCGHTPFWDAPEACVALILRDRARAGTVNG